MRVECKSVRPLAMRVHSAHSKIRVHAEQSIKRWLRGKKNNNKSRPRERAFRLLELVSPIPKFPKRVRFVGISKTLTREHDSTERDSAIRRMASIIEIFKKRHRQEQGRRAVKLKTAEAKSGGRLCGAANYFRNFH